MTMSRIVTSGLVGFLAVALSLSVAGPAEAKQSSLGAGAGHTCAVLDGGLVRCWGDGADGRLGYGNTATIGDDETPGSVAPVDLGAGRTATAVSAGLAFTCAILDDGSVRCWGDAGAHLGRGDNSFSDVGDNETPGSIPPLDLGAGRTARAISAGFNHVCAVLDDGSVRCWGFGSDGRLGYGNSDSIGDNETPGSAGPVDLGAGRTAVAISAGRRHTCAVLDDGSVRCWGEGLQGRLGYGNTEDVGDDELPGSVGPVDLGAGRTAVAIGAGFGHTCAVLDDGSVRCWGPGGRQLGYGDSRENIGDNETPGSVGPADLGAGRTAVAIGLGWGHTCAILDNGSLRCWGTSFAGLGLGSTDATMGDVDLGAGRTAAAVSAGAEHTCAVLDNASVRCWGYHERGRLGLAMGPDAIGDDEAPSSVAPLDLGPGRTGAAISAGLDHACAVLDDGSVRCWGFGQRGRLGYGNTEDVGDDELPGSVGPVDLGAGRTAVAISAGGEHTCALLDDASVRCWGGGGGQLGNSAGDVGDDETPGSVDPIDFGSGRTAVAVSAGGRHTCAILDDASVRCFGNGGEGQLGYGNFDNIGDNEPLGSVGPVDLGAGRTAVAIAAGGSHTCAVLDDGSVRCWGDYSWGQLGPGHEEPVGDDETPGSVDPVDLGSGRTAVAISAGSLHTCALLDDASVFCWGYDDSGRLGGGTVNLGAGRTALAVSAGGTHSCALLDDSSVRCWGLGVEGALGQGVAALVVIYDPATVGPVDLGSGRTALAVAAGGHHTCALLDDETVRCFGLNSDYGRIGHGSSPSHVGDDETPGSVGTLDLGGDVDLSDSEAPVTTDDVPGGFRNAPVTVTLSATDSGGSGVDKTYFTKGAEPAAPTTASAVYDPGAKPTLGNGERIKYFSTDGAGNAEAVKVSETVRVDSAAPTTSDDVPAGFRNAPVVVSLSVSDSGGSGVDKTYFTKGAAPADPTTASPVYDAGSKPTLADGEQIKYFSVDLAGNAEAVKTSVTAKVDGGAPATTDDVPVAETYFAATVTLAAVDSGGAGVDKTYYSVGVAPADPTTASSVYDPASKPTLLPGQRIKYFTVDLAGNAETVKVSRTLRRDVDFDNDGVVDGADNCPLVANRDQRNGYGDARGDACEQDTFAPKLTGLKLVPAKFKVAGGTVITFTLDEAVAVTYTLEKRKAGRVVGKRCRKRTRLNARNKKCDLPLKGSFKQGAFAGRSSLPWPGTWRGKELAPGQYRLTLSFEDGGGNEGSEQVSFKVSP
jgi:alpha-tubulin suppressor-like RCC1 family protein